MLTRRIVLGPEFDHLPDDSEETLVGSSLHQGNITGTYTSLVLVGPKRGLPWFVGNQLRMIVSRQGRKRTYQPSPDILVHTTLTSSPRTSLLVDFDGPPSLAIEITSPSTAMESDLNVTSPDGKPKAYEEIGIPEYLVFDPVEDFIPGQIWARRMGVHGYEPWEPEENGRWVSRELGGVAFAPIGLFLRVYDQDGILVPLTEEFADIVSERDQRLAERERQLTERDRQLAERDRKIAELEAELRRLREQHD
jgi:Uma2 family endonuclease